MYCSLEVEPAGLRGRTGEKGTSITSRLVIDMLPMPTHFTCSACSKWDAWCENVQQSRSLEYRFSQPDGQNIKHMFSVWLFTALLIYVSCWCGTLSGLGLRKLLQTIVSTSLQTLHTIQCLQTPLRAFCAREWAQQNLTFLTLGHDISS